MYNGASSSKQCLLEDVKHSQSYMDFTEEEIKEMEMVYEESPKEAQYIVEYLKDPAFFLGAKNTDRRFLWANLALAKL